MKIYILLPTALLWRSFYPRTTLPLPPKNADYLLSADSTITHFHRSLRRIPKSPLESFDSSFRFLKYILTYSNYENKLSDGQVSAVTYKHLCQRQIPNMNYSVYSRWLVTLLSRVKQGLHQSISQFKFDKYFWEAVNKSALSMLNVRFSGKFN